MSFDPGLTSMREAGITASSRPYEGTSAQQIRMSLETMAAKMRDGRVDSSVNGWAIQCLKEHGLDGRDSNTTAFKQGAALLECIRAATIYVSDPYGVELIPSASATLCLRPNLCLQGQDCDGLSVALGSLYMSIGLPVQIVKQNFGPDQQEHVLIVVHDGTTWQYADPSTNLPFGSALQARDEVWVDPMAPIGALPEAAPTIVTFGKPAGLGAWQLVTDSAVHAKSRYRFAVLLNLVNWPAGAVSTITPQAVKDIFSKDWVVSTAAPTGDVTGGVQSWIIEGIAKTEGTFANSSFITNVAEAVEVPDPAPPPPKAKVDVAMVALGAAGLALVGGVVWHSTRKRR